MEVIWSRTAKKNLYAILESHIRKDKSKDPSSDLFKAAIDDLKVLVKYPFIGLRTSADNIFAYRTGSLLYLFEVSGKRIIIHSISEK